MPGVRADLFALVGGVPTASVVMEQPEPTRRGDNASLFLCNPCAPTAHLFDRRAERRGKFFTQWGRSMKKVRSSLSRLAGPGQSPGRSIAMERNPLTPNKDQESTRTLSRGSRYGKVVRCHLPIPERGQHHRLTQYVGLRGPARR